MRRNLLAALVLIAVLSLTGWTLQASRTSWEYKTEHAPSDKKMNELGSEGWELIAIGAKGGGPSVNVLAYVFKRAK